MAQHLSFLDDAVEEFLYAFNLYQTLTTANAISKWAQCVRSFYIAFEKGFKHTASSINPYLIISKPEQKLILNLSRDLIERPVPSIFCSRHPVETLNMFQTWKVLYEFYNNKISTQIVSEFEQGLNQLAELRHRMQHGELFEEIHQIIAIIERILARFLEIMNVINPEWVTKLKELNNQLESRLKGIEKQVDANWQVLLDYLHRHKAIQIKAIFFVITRNSEIRLFIGEQEQIPSTDHILAGTVLSRESAEGLFTSILTDEQISERYNIRRMNTKNEEEGYTPLETGSIKASTMIGFLSIHLKDTQPNFLSVTTRINDFVVDFPEPINPKGTVNGKLSCAVQKGSQIPASLLFTGSAIFRNEYIRTYESQESEEPGVGRVIDLELLITE